MTYKFSGILTSDFYIEEGIDLKDIYSIRKIDSPFKGSGIYLPMYSDRDPNEEEIIKIVNSVGLSKSDNWLFINYICWAGRIDYVYAYLNSCGKITGPVEESDLNKTSDLFVNIMEGFGVPKEKALDFKPFYRGFWNE
ncbi:MAG: hypothetical protein GY714_00225 [Desulfobacterales bacterium]|nr:hypothetical protein [Desulfobacterales bacterium]